jgi:hypothetical protein
MIADDREYHETAALPWRNEILSSTVVLSLDARQGRSKDHCAVDDLAHRRPPIELQFDREARARG